MGLMGLMGLMGAMGQKMHDSRDKVFCNSIVEPSFHGCKNDGRFRIVGLSISFSYLL